jgi:DNA-binding transcriptional LysR family regulator
VLALVGQRFADHFGDLEPFWFGVTRAQAEQALTHFVETTLPRFGDFQDAMLEGEAFLYHSVLSIYINVGLLDPLDVCRRVEAAYRAGYVPLNAAEGYIRQIIGWREYVRGIYWLKMPEYVEQNWFGHTCPVPEFYWTGETDMACLRSAIGQTKREAYAHHIQRLMLTGNFALLAGVSPQALHEWYLLVYADAFEWVELPNTLGMSQFDVTIRIGILADSSLIARRLAPARRVLVAAPEYVKGWGAPGTPDDLAQHRCLNYGHTTTLQRWQLTQDGQTFGVAINSVMCSNNGDVLRAAALAGQGITKLPTFLVGPDIKAGRLAVVLPEYLPTELGVFALYAPNRYLAAKTRLLIDFLAARLGERPSWEETKSR